MSKQHRRAKIRGRFREHIGGPLAEGVDDLFINMAFKNPRVGARATRASVVARVASAAQTYPEAEARGALFPEPPLPQYQLRKSRSLKGGAARDLRWESAYQALDDGHAQTLARLPRNQTCQARWFRHKTPGPVVICLHGWGVGYLGMEEHTFEVAKLYRQGLDVVLFSLPFHGRRSPWTRLGPMFPTIDPIRTNEGFAQGIMDLRALIQILRVEGASTIGVAGMSLGAFTASLLATVEESLDFLIPIIGFGSLGELVWDHIEGSPMAELALSRGLTEAGYKAALAPTTPLERAPKIDGSRVLVIAGARDGVTPLRHSLALRAHFKGSTLATYPGGHVMQVGRQSAFKQMIAFIEAVS